jgi:sec-independent protein translocase protein TatB
VINFPGPEKILMLAVIALVVLGPSRLPQAARTAGKWIGELRKLTARFQEEVSGAIGEPNNAITSAMGDLTKQVGGWRNEMAGVGRTITSAVIGTATPDSTGAGADAGADTAAAAGTAVGAGTTQATPTAATAPLAADTHGSTNGATYSSTVPAVAGGRGGLPILPPTPDDPSLN